MFCILDLFFTFIQTRSSLCYQNRYRVTVTFIVMCNVFYLVQLSWRHHGKLSCTLYEWPVQSLYNMVCGLSCEAYAPGLRVCPIRVVPVAVIHIMGGVCVLAWAAMLSQIEQPFADFLWNQRVNWLHLPFCFSPICCTIVMRLVIDLDIRIDVVKKQQRALVLSEVEQSLR